MQPTNAPADWTAERITTLRHALSLTQERFAARVGVTFSAVNRWERGQAVPSPLAREKLDALAREVAA